MSGSTRSTDRAGRDTADPVRAATEEPVPVVARSWRTARARVGVAWRAATGWLAGPGRAALIRSAPLTGILGLAAAMRFWHLTAIGFNSDEAVYAGTAASVAGDQSLRGMFPVFRAHPLLFQMLVALAGHGHRPSEWAARAVPATIGILTVWATYLLGRQLYGRGAGLVAALLLALMPYEVIVSRQVLLDGLMTLCATVVLYCVVRYAESARLSWLLAAGATMGMGVLAKETSVVLLGGLYAFFALTPAVRMRVRHLALATVAMVLAAAPAPIVLSLSGRAATGQNYLLWQMLRRPNHGWDFYLTVLPGAVGVAVLIAALAGLVWLRRESTWRERLLLCWIAVPVAFFTLWPVKGYQYLLPIAPVVAVLAGRALARIPTIGILRASGRPSWLPRVTGYVAVLGVAVTLAVPSWGAVNPTATGNFLAGTGGLPGGREAGYWVRDHVPAGAQLLASGPSIANVLEYYGGRRVFALSVSTNPNERNPAYVPVPNPDRAVRDGQFQYIVWDSYTASRAPFFADETRRLVNKFHGVPVFTVGRPAASNKETPIIVIYLVRAV